jgi:hypothetical protein
MAGRAEYESFVPFSLNFRFWLNPDGSNQAIFEA